MLHVESMGTALGLLLVMHCIVQTDIRPGLYISVPSTKRRIEQGFDICSKRVR